MHFAPGLDDDNAICGADIRRGGVEFRMDYVTCKRCLKITAKRESERAELVTSLKDALARSLRVAPKRKSGEVTGERFAIWFMAALRERRINCEGVFCKALAVDVTVDANGIAWALCKRHQKITAKREARK